MKKAATPSNRSFGTLFVVLFALLGGHWWWRNNTLFPWAFGLAALILLVTVAKPDWLTSANRAWMKLADLLHRVVTPVALGIMFFCVLTPMALVMRMTGRDAMKRRFDPAARTYWIERDPPGPDPAGLPNQF